MEKTFIFYLFTIIIIPNIYSSNPHTIGVHNPYQTPIITYNNEEIRQRNRLVLDTLTALGHQPVSISFQNQNIQPQQEPQTPFLELLKNIKCCQPWLGSDRQKELWNFCTTFNKNRQIPRIEKFNRLSKILHSITQEELNAFNEQGQTLTHRLSPLADKELYLFLSASGLNLAEKSRENGTYANSTILHNLAALYRKAKTNPRKKHIAIRYYECLQMISQKHPDLFYQKANNGLTPKDILER